MNDSDIEYERIPVLLKRYSFKSKMEICSLKSLELIEDFHLKIECRTNIIYPWELEIIAMFSLLSEEYDNKDIISNIRQFNKCYYLDRR